MHDPVRLDPSITFEPLVSRWHATWFVVAPLPAALAVARQHLPALRSFLEDPAKHYDIAHRVPGSNFIALPADEVEFVRGLLGRTEAESAHATELAAALAAAEDLLASHPQGDPMQDLYAQLPGPVRGYAELVYDYYSRPNLRFDEGLLYASPHFARAKQSISVFPLLTDDSRTFASSTPRPPSQDLAELRVPFDDPRLARLFALDARAAERAEICELLADLGVAEADCDSLLQPAAPEPPPPRPTGSVRVRYFGHACVLFDDGRTSVLVDPMIAAVAKAGPSRHTFADLPPVIDYAVITHAHADHFVVETLIRLRGRIGVLIVPRQWGLCYGDISLRRVAQQLGYTDIREVDTGDAVQLPDGEIVVAPFWGEHGDIAHGSRCTYVVRLGSKRALLFADAQVYEPAVYRNLRSAVGPIETVFMNTEVQGAPLTWQYEAVFPPKRNRRGERKRRCRGSNREEALALIDAVGASRFVNYAMGLEPWCTWLLGPPPARTDPRFVEADSIMAEVRARGGEAIRLDGKTDFTL